MSVDNEIKHLRVLIIDERLYLANLARQALKGLGPESISVASRADAALELIRAMQPDIILISLEFDDSLTGLEIIRLIRTSDDIADRTTPIIAMSDRPSMSKVTAARDLGVHAFVRIPFSALDLAQHVKGAGKDRRDFVLEPNYAGPDRRTRSSENYDGPERRKQEPNIYVGPRQQLQASRDAQSNAREQAEEQSGGVSDDVETVII